MPFSSGTYSLPAGNPVVTATTIQSSWANNTMTDVATALSTCVLKDGTQTVTANIPMSNFKLTGLGSGTALTDAANLGQIQNGTSTYLTAVAGTNTITATATPTPTLAVGQRFWFIPANTNTGAATLNISSTGAGAVQLNGAALIGGELAQNIPVEVFVTAVTPVYEIATVGGFINALVTANRVFAGPSSGAATIPGFRALVPADLSMTPIAASMTADIALTSTASYYDGPVIAQGTAGSWFVSGTVTCTDTTNSTIYAKLWDGTTVIDSAALQVFTNSLSSVSLSGYITNPVGNIRISCQDVGTTSAHIKFNGTGNSKDSTITAIRIG